MLEQEKSVNNQLMVTQARIHMIFWPSIVIINTLADNIYPLMTLTTPTFCTFLSFFFYFCVFSMILYTFYAALQQCRQGNLSSRWCWFSLPCIAGNERIWIYQTLSVAFHEIYKKINRNIRKRSSISYQIIVRYQKYFHEYHKFFYQIYLISCL